MSYESRSGTATSGRSRSNRGQPNAPRRPDREGQPAPTTPGVSRQAVREHARRLFRDQWAGRPLTQREWRLAEEDLVRTLEADEL